MVLCMLTVAGEARVKGPPALGLLNVEPCSRRRSRGDDEDWLPPKSKLTVSL